MSSLGTSMGGVQNKGSCAFSRMVGLPISKNPVIRTGEAGQLGSTWRDERMERLKIKLLKGLGRLITDFFRLLKRAGDPAPCSCISIIYLGTVYTPRVFGVTFCRAGASLARLERARGCGILGYTACQEAEVRDADKQASRPLVSPFVTAVLFTVTTYFRSFPYSTPPLIEHNTSFRIQIDNTPDNKKIQVTHTVKFIATQ